MTDNLDIDLKVGVTSSSTYQKLLSAEIYGTATPMQWLVRKLSILRSVIKSGLTVKFDTGTESGMIDNEKKYIGWCEKNFPSAHGFIK